ncbi:MAG: Ldh family oxidoreductase [Mycobacterium sp.]|nr:Ldh family oxidoreductase [Mycobacterium sp.]
MTTTNNVGGNVVVAADQLHDVILQILVSDGATVRDATQQAAQLVEGDLRDHHSHGVRRLPVLVGRLRNGLISSGRPILTNWLTESFVSVDGQQGFGPAVAMETVDLIMDRAAKTGIAAAAVRNANHVGMLAPYLERMAAGSMIGIGLTTSEALVHPWGSARAMVGTNPIGIGVPTGDGPLVLDMSTGSVSMGKVLDHAARGAPIPDGWAVDTSGSPTTDARAAAAGAISPFGGPKGFALGLAFEALVGVITGTSFGTAVTGTLDTTEPATKGDVFVCLSVGRLGLGAQLPVLHEYLNEVRASGVDGLAVTVPGDRARAVRADRLATGIPLDTEVWQRTLALLEHSEPERTD